MIRNVKRIVASTLIASTFSALPIGNNFMTTKAYAASEFNLKSIYLSDGEIKFSADTRNYNIKVDGDVDKIRITAKPDCTSAHYDDYKVDIDGAIVDNTDNFRTEVSLYKGKNEVKVRIENEDGKKKVYTLNITRGKLDSEAYGNEIYLKDIYLDYGDLYIDFDKDITSYNIEVEDTMDQIAINGIPDDSDDTVRINGSIVKEDKDDDKDKDNKNSTKDYKKIVKLDKGKNVVEIEIEDDDNKKTYKLNITRGKATDSKNNSVAENNTNATTANKENNASTTTSGTTNKENSTTNKENNTKFNKWVQENGVWKYNGETGIPLKNKWFNDKSNGAWYYLGDDGSRKEGWQYIDNNWYYLDSNGVMKTGWQAIGSDWYFLNSNGTMKTGWMIGSDGKYYNLQTSGKMSKDTVVDGYKVGTDGAWTM